MAEQGRLLASLRRLASPNAPADYQPRKDLKVLVLMVCTGTAHQGEALRALRSLHGQFRDGYLRHYLVVENALPAGACERPAPDLTIIGGDNSLREFSAFNRVFAHLGDGLGAYDVVNVVTEAFNVDYQYYLSLFTPKMLSLVADRNIALGHLDGYGEDVTLMGERSSTWIRTCYFYLSSRALGELGTFVTTDGSGRLFSSDPGRPFAEGSFISPNYQGYLLQWLTGRGRSWAATDVHRHRFDLTQETFERFRFKVVSILNEHGLSIRMRKLGVPTVDVEWLHAMLARSPLGQIRWDTEVGEMMREVGRWRQALGVVPP